MTSAARTSPYPVKERNPAERRNGARSTRQLDGRPGSSPGGSRGAHERDSPEARSAAGFVAGYWLEPADGQGFSIVLFEKEEQAREGAPPVSSWAAPGIAITRVEFRRVAATA
jgi:hypothetical protein